MSPPGVKQARSMVAPPRTARHLPWAAKWRMMVSRSRLEIASTIFIFEVLLWRARTGENGPSPPVICPERRTELEMPRCLLGEGDNVDFDLEAHLHHHGGCARLR